VDRVLMGQAAAARRIRSRGLVYDPVGGAQGHGERGRSARGLVQVDVLKVREVAQVARAHEVGVRRRVEAAGLGRLGVGEVRRAARRPIRGVVILLVREGGHQRSRRAAAGGKLRGGRCTRDGDALQKLAGADVALRKEIQRVDVIMLGYDVQGAVVGSKVDSFLRAVVLASFRVLKDGGRHVESGA
jgi:hypothetical protein